jgi:hypothetical protein
MTSFSTYGTGNLALVDGSLATDDELAEEQLESIISCVASGAARALLDMVRDEADMDALVDATQWQSVDQGWETDAIVDEDLPAFLDMCERFVRDNVQNILNLAHRIAWDARWSDEHYWHGDEGMAIYRIGMLLGYTVHGDGIGFDDYYQPLLIDGKVTPQGDIVIRPLKAWVEDRDNRPYYEDTWIDSTEEPCRLHLS